MKTFLVAIALCVISMACLSKVQKAPANNPAAQTAFEHSIIWQRATVEDEVVSLFILQQEKLNSCIEPQGFGLTETKEITLEEAEEIYRELTKDPSKLTPEDRRKRIMETIKYSQVINALPSEIERNGLGSASDPDHLRSALALRYEDVDIHVISVQPGSSQAVGKLVEDFVDGQAMAHGKRFLVLKLISPGAINHATQIIIERRIGGSFSFEYMDTLRSNVAPVVKDLVEAAENVLITKNVQFEKIMNLKAIQAPMTCEYECVLAIKHRIEDGLSARELEQELDKYSQSTTKKRVQKEELDWVKARLYEYHLGKLDMYKNVQLRVISSAIKHPVATPTDVQTGNIMDANKNSRSHIVALDKPKPTSLNTDALTQATKSDKQKAEPKAGGISGKAVLGVGALIGTIAVAAITSAYILESRDHKDRKTQTSQKSLGLANSNLSCMEQGEDEKIIAYVKLWSYLQARLNAVELEPDSGVINPVQTTDGIHQ